MTPYQVISKTFHTSLILNDFKGTDILLFGDNCFYNHLVLISTICCWFKQRVHSSYLGYFETSPSMLCTTGSTVRITKTLPPDGHYPILSNFFLGYWPFNMVEPNHMWHSSAQLGRTSRFGSILHHWLGSHSIICIRRQHQGRPCSGEIGGRCSIAKIAPKAWYTTYNQWENGRK